MPALCDLFVFKEVLILVLILLTVIIVANVKIEPGLTIDS